jgi:hypothetical protein
MLYIIDIRRTGTENLLDLMADMRTWLDHNRIEPELFVHSSGAAGAVFRVGFKTEDHATAFADAFGGRLAWTDPHGAILWKITTETGLGDRSPDA